jgi:bifunctional non-homologous end joining protein LigD
MTSSRVEVTRPDKLLWPAIGITKQAYVDYLGAVADRMLPWLRDRPLSLVRAPDGVDGQRYFQKNTPSHAPSWIKTVSIPAPSANRDVAYTV